jgi:hypothetical protein
LGLVPACMQACEVQRARVVPRVCVGVGERIIDSAVFAAGTRDRGGAGGTSAHVTEESQCGCLGASPSEEKKEPDKGHRQERVDGRKRMDAGTS